MSDDSFSESDSLSSSDEEYIEPVDSETSTDESDTEEINSSDVHESRRSSVPVTTSGSYNDEDRGPPSRIPDFRPARQPGPQLTRDEIMTRAGARNFLTALDFFKLYWTVDLVHMICTYTNSYAAEFGPTIPSMYKHWKDITEAEFYVFLGLLIYHGLKPTPGVHRAWSTKSLYHGDWSRGFMPKKRYCQIMSFLKVSNYKTEKKDDKLCKVRFLYDYIHRKCQSLYQPDMYLSLDERMVRNKGRYSFRQYIRDKPTKWGMKLWVLAESKTGYTYDFEVYLGKQENSSPFGLAYDVVMRLVKSVTRQGYRLFFDNFYTSFQLLKDLLKLGICACGTVISNRKGFPNVLKDIKSYEKNSERGDMRWVRDEEILALQWRDNKTVSFLSNFHSAKGYAFVTRRSKVHGEYRKLLVRQPSLVNDYNKYMGGVDKSDQMIKKYNSLHQSKKYWKTLFFHFIDIARLNSYVLFQKWRELNIDIEEMKRSKRYGQREFTEELVRNLGGFEEYDDVPLSDRVKRPLSHSIIPVRSKKKRNCKLCYKRFKIERKVKTKCATCDTHLCFQKGDTNCLIEFHET